MFQSLLNNINNYRTQLLGKIRDKLVCVLHFSRTFLADDIDPIFARFSLPILAILCKNCLWNEAGDLQFFIAFLQVYAISYSP